MSKPHTFSLELELYNPQHNYCFKVGQISRLLDSIAQLKDIRCLLHRLNPLASVHETIHSQVPLSEVLNTKRFDMEKVGARVGMLMGVTVDIG
eukprot:52973-Pelagomonas_calceolata.AAC.4